MDNEKLKELHEKLRTQTWWTKRKQMEYDLKESGFMSFVNAYAEEVKEKTPDEAIEGFEYLLEAYVSLKDTKDELSRAKAELEKVKNALAEAEKEVRAEE